MTKIIEPGTMEEKEMEQGGVEVVTIDVDLNMLAKSKRKESQDQGSKTMQTLTKGERVEMWEEKLQEQSLRAIPINVSHSITQLFASPPSVNNTFGDIVRLVGVRPEEDSGLYDELNRVLEKHQKGNLK